MAEIILFRELCKPSVLKIGWHLAQLDSRDDFISDPVCYCDFASCLTERLAHILEEVRDKRYRPRHLIELDIPKSGLSVRPGNVLPIEEATILQAIVYLLAPRLDPCLSESVYSFRLHKKWKARIKIGKSLFKDEERELPFLQGKTIRKLSPFEPWYRAWPEFDRARIIAAREAGFTHLTRTDIASYFENIDLRLLEAQLRGLLPKQGELMQLLMRILESWTRVTSTGTPIGRGIPQGNDASSFFGNIYLLPLDDQLQAFCSRRDACWFRYVDDVEVYSKDYQTARDVVFVINEALRALYLNLQGSKTEILTGHQLDQVLSSSDSEAIEATWKELESIDCRAVKNRQNVTSILENLKPLLGRFRRGLPDSAWNLSKRDSRVLRRLMTLYGRCGRTWLRKTAFAALEEPPDLRMLHKCLSYLMQMPYREHASIADRLLKLVEGATFPIPYHSAMVLNTVRLLHPIDGGKGLAARIRSYAFLRKRDWTIRQKALESISTLPVREDHAVSQARRFLRDEHPWVRRAGCVLLVRGEVEAVRREIGQLVYSADPSLNRLALHWHRYLTDSEFVLKEINRLGKGARSDQAFICQLPVLWLFRCSPDVKVVIALRTYLQRFTRSRSGKVKWHLAKLMELTEWVA
jgi:hypothetical protein